MKSSRLVPWNWFMRESQPAETPSRAGRRHAFVTPALPFYMELDRLFDNFFSGYFPHVQTKMDKSLAEAAIRPNLDISGDEKRYVITVELPGVSEQDLNVEIDNNTLRISGEKRYERDSRKEEAGSDDDEQGKNFYRIERSYGSFQRTLELPDDVDAEAITASHKDGVLTITVPRKESVLQNARRIAITQPSSGSAG